MQTDTPQGTAPPPNATKLAIEFGPLVAFLVTQKVAGIYWATGVLMVGMVVALSIAWFRERRLPVMMLVTGIVALIFGGLTLYLQDATFIKVKPTIVNSLFAITLTVGLLLGRLFLKVLLGPVFPITDAGWRAMTVRWIGLFVALAIVNEIVWRNFSDDTWATWKVFGNLGLTLAFSVTLLPLLKKHALPGVGAE
ncbi:MAG: septation protein A [Planctomycetota bacterium]